jgi:hypothetical protein
VVHIHLQSLLLGGLLLAAKLRLKLLLLFSFVKARANYRESKEHNESVGEVR